MALEVVAAQLMTRDASANVLITDGAAEHRGAAAALGRFHRLAADHRILDVFEHLLVGLALVVVRVHVDDQKILIVARARLLRGMLEMLCAGVVIGGEFADFAAGHVHGRSSLDRLLRYATTKTSSPRRTTSNFFNRSRRSPTHSPVFSSYS